MLLKLRPAKEKEYVGMSDMKRFHMEFRMTRYGKDDPTFRVFQSLQQGFQTQTGLLR
jgi:hypothetical protein